MTFETPLAPLVSLEDNSPNELYSSFQGVSASTPSTLFAMGGIILRADDVAGLTSITVQGPSGGVVPMLQAIEPPLGPIPDPAHLEPGIKRVVGEFPLPAVGVYTVTVENAYGRRTVTPFRIASIGAALAAGSHAIYSEATGRFDWDATLDLSASLGLDRVERFENAGPFSGLLIESTDLLGVSSAQKAYAQLSPIGPGDEQTLSTLVVDGDGNTLRYDLGLEAGISGNVGGLSGPGDFNMIGFNDAGLGGTYDNTAVSAIVDPATGQLIRHGLTTPDQGSYTSPVFDLLGGAPPFDKPMLPGAIMRLGRIEDPYSHQISTWSAAQAAAEYADGVLSAGPIVASLMTVTVTLWTGDQADLSDASPQQVYTAGVKAQGLDPPPSPQRLTVKRYLQLKASLSRPDPAAILAEDCLSFTDPAHCSDGRRRVPFLTGLGQSLLGLKFNEFTGPTGMTEFPAGEAGLTSPLGLGWTISGLSTTEPGNIDITIGSGRSEPTWRGLPLNTVFDLRATGPFFLPFFGLSVDFDGSGLTPEQLGLVKLVPVNSMGKIGTKINASMSGNRLSFAASALGRYMIEAPAFPDPVAIRNGNMELLYSAAGHNPPGPVTLGPASPDDPRLLLLRAQGKAPVGPVLDIGPSGTVFSPPASLRVDYSEEERQALGIGQGIQIFELSSGQAAIPLPTAFAAYEPAARMALISGLNSLYGVFGDTKPVLLADATPPQTQLVFNGPSGQDAPGSFTIGTQTTVGFLAQDPSVPDSVTSGVDKTYYLVDQPFVDMTQTPPQVFSQPFALPPGQHGLVFFSRDLAGNLEAPKTASVRVAVPGNGQAIATDAAGKLWMVVENAGAFHLARFSANGLTEEAAAALPGATDSAQWTIAFDASGNAHAVGTAAGTSGTDLIVYKVSPQAGLLSSARFGLGPGTAALSLDSSGDLWITGAMQGSSGITLGLWRYSFQDQTLSLKSSFSRAGIDGGFGVRTVADGIWVAGYSSPGPPGPSATLDLALWKFSADGQTLLTGPILRPGYRAGLEGELGAKLEAGPSGLYVAAQKSASSGRKDLAFLHYDLTGRLLMERTWAAGSGADASPNDTALLPDGNLLVAGKLSGVQSQAAVWTYTPDGLFASAQTQAGAGGAQGAALVHAELWLAVQGSGLPFHFSMPTALAGTDALVSSAATYGVSLAIDPGTINKKSNAPYLTAAVEVTGSKSAADIDPATLRIVAVDGTLLAVPLYALTQPPPTVADADSDGIADLAAKFDRQALQQALPSQGQVLVTVSGSFIGGGAFTASSLVVAKSPGKLAAAADEEFSLRDLYAFPNPARGGQRPTVRVQVGLADEVEVNFYDVSGQLVHRGSCPPPQVIDDGNGKGPQYTYDCPWDAAGAGTGVYTYAVTAKKAGSSLIRKLGKVGVIK